jgi:hypothetical protein
MIDFRKLKNIELVEYDSNLLWYELFKITKPIIILEVPLSIKNIFKKYLLKINYNIMI